MFTTLRSLCLIPCCRLQIDALADKTTKKDEKKKLQEEINALFKPVAQTVAKGLSLHFVMLDILSFCMYLYNFFFPRPGCFKNVS